MSGEAKERKELHPAWRVWFLAIALLPMAIGATVFLCDLEKDTQWYQVTAIVYTVLMGVGCLIATMVFESMGIHLFRSRPETISEKAKREVEESWPTT